MAKEGVKKKETPKGKRVLIINNESQYMKDLKKVVKDHAGKKAKVDTANINEAKAKLTKEDRPYDAVILSGSHKRKYDNQEVQEIIKHIDQYNESNPGKRIAVYGTCLGHQALAHYHGGKVDDLGKYQKGTKTIQLKEGGEAKTHKHHRYGVTNAGGLEVIADSTVQSSKGKAKKIVEAAKHKSKPYSSHQGHPEREGHARDLLYQFLEGVYGK